MNGDLNVVSSLIEAGAALDFLDASGNTAATLGITQGT